MKFSYGKVIWFLVVFGFLALGIWGIVKFCSNTESEKDPTKKYPNSVNFENVPFYDERGRNMSVFIEANCLKASFMDCIDTRHYWNSEIEEWVRQNNLSQCAIVKWVQNHCKNTSDLECNGDFCSLPKEAFANVSDCGFFHQDYFFLTKQNIEIVKNSSHGNRYTCISKDGKIEVEENNICVSNLALLNAERYQILGFEGVMLYLAANLKNYTILHRFVAKMIDYKNITNGTQIYTISGKKVYNSTNEDVYVLPSELFVNEEVISWMRYDRMMSMAICNSLGARRLSEEEIAALPPILLDLDCFFDKFGSYIQKKEPAVWVLNHALKFKNFTNVTDNHDFFLAARYNDYLIVKNGTLITELPNDWIRIHQNIFLRKSGSRHIEGSKLFCPDYLANKFFSDFYQSGEFAVIDCLRDKNDNGRSEQLHKVFYLNSTSIVPIKFKSNFLQSNVGQELLIERGEIPKGEIILSIDLRSCQKYLGVRNEFPIYKDNNLKCIQENGRVKLVK